MTFTPISLGSGLTSYNYLKRTRESQQALFDQTPVISRDVNETRQRLDEVQTSDDLMADRTLLKVALGAFGLDEDLNNRAFIQKILDSNLDDRQSLANKLTDKRYLALAEAFNFSGSDGPQLPDSQKSDELTKQLEGLENADALLSDPALLRATLQKFGLEGNEKNTYFLKQVLESDLSDPKSFVNRLNDEQLMELSQTFDFHQKEIERSQSETRVDQIANIFSDLSTPIETAQDLLAQPEAFEEALNIFGLSNIYTSEFFENVLNSNLNDSTSFANTMDDDRFRTFTAAFSFATPLLNVDNQPITDGDGNTVIKTGTLEAFLDQATALQSPLQSADDFLSNRSFRDATFDLLGIPKTVAARGLAERVLQSDPDDENSFANLFPDPRYQSLSDLFTFEPAPTQRRYPDGFVDQVVRNYLERQFEIQVGEVDPDMRVALSLERELNQLVGSGDNNDAQWFSVMSSPPLRQVFEGAFRLPSSFGSIDIDQQLSVLKQKSESFFGTVEVRDYMDSDVMDKLRQDYLTSRSTQNVNSFSSANAASIILAGF